MNKHHNKLQASILVLLFSAISNFLAAQGSTSTSAYKISKESLKEYVGQYNFDQKAEMGFDVTVSLDGNTRLMAQHTDKSQPLTLLAALEKDSFELVGTNGLRIAFTRNEKGKIVSLKLYRGDQSFTALRKD